MMALGELVIVSVLAEVENAAVPLATVGATGKAYAPPERRESAAATTTPGTVNGGGPPFPLTISATITQASLTRLHIRR